MSAIKFSDTASIAAKYINNTNRHVFLTGKAGTGKTTFLTHIKKFTYKNAIVAAPTGIAAINAGGVTLHSLFQLPFGCFIPTNNIPADFEGDTQINTPKSLIGQIQMNKVKKELLREMELLIIDEVSMLRADLLDAIDTLMRKIRRSSQEFGGLQILFIGDLMQLPPVVKNNEWRLLSHFYPGIYFFQSLALQENKPIYIELEKIFRQNDPVFISILSRLRDNRILAGDIELLNRQYKPGIRETENKGSVFLTTHNRKANAINEESLKKLTGDSRYFRARITGNFPEYLYPLDDTLELKKDAQVMFIKNDYSGNQRYFNGKIGTVEYLDKENIQVGFTDGSDSPEVEMYTWEYKKYSLNKETGEIEERVEGTFSQFPLKLAWAITIHKSQGLTFDNAIIDVSEAFAPGQVYVALSRLTSLEGLVLNAPLPEKGLEPDWALTEYTREKQDIHEIRSALSFETKKFIREMLLRSFDFGWLYWQFRNHADGYVKDAKRSKKKQYHSWAVNLLNEFNFSKSVADKFLKQLSQIPIRPDDYMAVMTERVVAAWNHFNPILTGFSKEIIEQAEKAGNQVGMKKYLKELNDLEAAVFAQLKKIHKSRMVLTAISQGTALSKQDVLESKLMAARKEFLDTKTNRTGKSSSTKRRRSADTGKSNTRAMSYAMYLEGKSIEEIANERSLAESTIEGHLAHYVEGGYLDAERFVEKYKIKPIQTVMERLDTFDLRSIKELLGDEFSYSDIRFVTAAQKFKYNQQGNKEPS